MKKSRIFCQWTIMHPMKVNSMAMVWFSMTAGYFTFIFCLMKKGQQSAVISSHLLNRWNNEIDWAMNLQCSTLCLWNPYFTMWLNINNAFSDCCSWLLVNNQTTFPISSYGCEFFPLSMVEHGLQAIPSFSLLSSSTALLLSEIQFWAVALDPQ